MLGVYYESYKGGANNLCVAIDSKTGLAAASVKNKDSAVRALVRQLKRSRREREACRKQTCNQ